MTEQDVQEFLDLIDYGDSNHYDILGLKPYNDFNVDNFNERINYLKIEISDSRINNEGLRYLFTAKATLINIQKKFLYDSQLKKK